MRSSLQLFTTAILATASFVTSAPTALHVDSTMQCVDGVMVIAARGSDSSFQNATAINPAYPDIGGLQGIANDIVNTVGKGSFIAAVPYAASIIDYFTSLGIGSQTVQSMIMGYTNKCKSTVTPKIVLLGYSQGAQVMSQALVGGNGVDPLEDAYVKSIVAGAIFADPSFVSQVEPIDAGSNDATSGVFQMPATTAATFNQVYGKILRSYCAAGDFYCAAGLNQQGMNIHGAEVQTYTQASEDFLLPIVKQFA